MCATYILSFFIQCCLIIQMCLVNGVIGVSARFPVEVEDNSATGPVYQQTVLMIYLNSEDAMKNHVNVSSIRYSFLIYIYIMLYNCSYV